MAWPGGTRGRLRDQAAARLDRLRADWRIPPMSADARRVGHSGATDSGATESGADEPAPPAEPPARWTPRAVRALVVVIAACLALAGWWWWSGRPRPVTVPMVVSATATHLPGAVVPADDGAGDDGAGDNGDATPTAPADATPALVVVHVAGAVRHPGLVELPAGARVADAVAAAGGVSANGSADSVNLARPLVDGEQIVVTDASAAPAAAAADGTPSAPVDLNHADAAVLQTLPGVGPVLAQRILGWREENGTFRSVDDLGEVPGIGDVILERLRPLVRV